MRRPIEPTTGPAIDGGGTLIGLDRASDLAIKAFKLPIRNVASGDRVFCPGSIVRVELDPTQPLSYGMAPHTAGFLSFGSAYEVAPSPDVQAIARYGEKEILLSGWLEGDSVIAGRAAAVQARVGSGRVILIGFSVHHEGQSHATFRLLFNSIFTSP